MINHANEHAHYRIYKLRNPKSTGFYRCVENPYEQLEQIWDDRYSRKYGFWRPYIKDVILRYPECGDLHFGFSRVRCEGCGTEFLLAYSCKRLAFWPSCHQKRVIEFGEWLCANVLKRYNISIFPRRAGTKY